MTRIARTPGFPFPLVLAGVIYSAHGLLQFESEATRACVSDVGAQLMFIKSPRALSFANKSMHPRVHPARSLRAAHVCVVILLTERK